MSEKEVINEMLNIRREVKAIAEWYAVDIAFTQNNKVCVLHDEESIFFGEPVDALNYMEKWLSDSANAHKEQLTSWQEWGLFAYKIEKEETA